MTASVHKMVTPITAHLCKFIYSYEVKVKPDQYALQQTVIGSS